MIHIDETRLDDSNVAIRVQGNLDRNTLPTLKQVCRQYFDPQCNDNVSMNLEELVHCCKESKSYLKEISDQVTYVGLPEFMKLELFGSLE
jgi:hypothetical protein